MNKFDILYEDNHLIVVVKPSNILSQKDITNDEDILTLVKEYIKEKYSKPGNVYLGLVHRLDRVVEGIMVLARTSKAAARLSKMFQDDLITKRYLALVEGNIKSDGEFEDRLLKLDNGNTIVDNKGKLAKLKYRVIKSIGNRTLVDIELITGRHHQIRVQFTHHGYPIVGEQRYFNSKELALELYSYYLEFTHPTTKEIMKFSYIPKNNIVGGLIDEGIINSIRR